MHIWIALHTPHSNAKWVKLIKLWQIWEKKILLLLLLLWSPRPSPPRHQANQQANKKNHLLIAPLCIRMYGMEDNLVFVNSPKKIHKRQQEKIVVQTLNDIEGLPYIIIQSGLPSTSNGLWFWIFPKDDKKRQLQTLTVVILRAYLTWLYSQGYPQYQQKIEIWILDYQAPRTQNNPV